MGLIEHLIPTWRLQLHIATVGDFYYRKPVEVLASPLLPRNPTRLHYISGLPSSFIFAVIWARTSGESLHYIFHFSSKYVTLSSNQLNVHHFLSTMLNSHKLAKLWHVPKIHIMLLKLQRCKDVLQSTRNTMCFLFVDKNLAICIFHIITTNVPKLRVYATNARICLTQFMKAAKEAFDKQ